MATGFGNFSPVGFGQPVTGNTAAPTTASAATAPAVSAPTQPINYARPAASGWTSNSISPSYSVLNAILGPASTGSATTGTLGASAGGAPAAVSPGFAPISPFSGGLPSVPSKGNLNAGMGGYGGGGASGTVYDPTVGRGGGGLGGPTGITDQAGNPIYTPEQAYAQYLGSLGSAISTTPQQQAFQRIMDLGNKMAYNPALLNNNGYVPSRINDPYTQNQQAQYDALRAFIPIASPYSTAYGTPSAQAPAPTPRWGYPTGYGMPAPGYQPAGGPAGYQPFNTAMPQY